MIFKEGGSGRLYRVLVPGLAEKRPSILRGDIVKAQRVGYSGKHQGNCCYCDAVDFHSN